MLAAALPIKQNSQVDVARLRAETRTEHEAVEALLPLTSPGLTRELYGEVLVCVYGVVSAWEQWAQSHAPQRLEKTVRERRRTLLLESDLVFLGKPVPHFDRPATLSSVLGDVLQRNTAAEATFLGAMYVMEGSTLGGQYIARHVEEVLGLEPGKGDAFYRGYGQQTGAMWRSFQDILKGLPDEYTEEVIAGARLMFGYFGEVMRDCRAAGTLRSLAVA
jgi:heme oxygenase (biliverdin-IX-beta and delta-forming)